MKRFKGFLAVFGAVLVALYSVVASATITYSPTIKYRGNMGDQAIVVAQIDLGGTYVTNGFTLTAKDFGLSTLNNVIIPNYAGYSFAWDRANGKVKVYSGGKDVTPSGTNSTGSVAITYTADTSGLALVYANTSGALFAEFSDSSSHNITIPAPTFTGVAIAAGAAEEVDNGTSLAAVNTIEIVVMGF